MTNFKKFQNKDCEFYPCHDTVDINCLFCFCPLYAFVDCGGDYTILDNGVKDCSKCLLPHTTNGYDYIVERLKGNK
jgi:Zn-finger protein